MYNGREMVGKSSEFTNTEISAALQAAVDAYTPPAEVAQESQNPKVGAFGEHIVGAASSELDLKIGRLAEMATKANELSMAVYALRMNELKKPTDKSDFTLAA